MQSENHTISWTCGRRISQKDNNEVTISNDYKRLLQSLVGSLDTELLLKSSSAAVRWGWADQWYAKVTSENRRHIFNLQACNDDGSRGWMLSYHSEVSPAYSPVVSWACGPQDRQHGSQCKLTLMEDITRQEHDETQRMLRDEMAQVMHKITEMQLELRRMADQPKNSGAKRTTKRKKGGKRMSRSSRTKS